MAKKNKKTNKMPTLSGDYLSVLATIFVLCMFTIQPIIVSPYKYLNITITKLVTFVVLASAFLLCTVVIYITKRDKPVKGASWFRQLYPYEYAILAYVAAMFISTLLSPDKMGAVLGTTLRNEGLLMQLLYMSVIWIIGRCYKPQEKHFSLFCNVGIGIGIYAIFQYYGADFLMLYPVVAPDTSGPDMLMMSTLSNRNVMSPYMCLVFIISAILFIKNEDRSYLKYLLFSWLACFILLIGSTESGYVGIMAAFAIALPFIAGSIKQLSRLFMVLAGAMLSGWIYVIAYLPQWRPNPLAPFSTVFLILAIVFGILAAGLQFAKWQGWMPLKKRCITWYLLIVIGIVGAFVTLPSLARATNNTTLNQISEIMQGNLDDDFGSGRIFIWRRLLPLAAERPIFGYGPDQFVNAFNQYHLEESMARYNGIHFDKAHNEYLQVLIDTGIAGLVPFVTILAIILWRSRKAWSNPLSLAIAAGVLCYMVQAFFNISTPITNSITWTFVGILAAVGNWAEAEGEA